MNRTTIFIAVVVTIFVSAILFSPGHSAEPGNCTPAPTNLVSWYRAEHNANDQQGNNQGTLQNGATFGVGKVGEAFNLDGIDDHVDIGDLAQLDNAAELTVMAWVRRTNTSGSLAGIIGKWDTGGAPDNSFLFYLGEPGPAENKGLLVVGFEDNTFHAVAGASVIPQDQWTFVAATWRSSDGQFKLYKNGVEDGSNIGGIGKRIKAHRAYTAKIGEWGVVRTSVYKFPGQIDEPAILNRALSASEIQAIFNADSSGMCGSVCTPLPANPISLYKAENNANDSISTNHGALLNGATFAPGRVGEAFSFNGVDAMVNVPFSSALNVATAVTIEAWVRTTSTVTGDHKLIAGRPGNYQLFKLDDGRPGFAVVIGGQFVNVFAATPLQANTFAHVAGTYDAATGQVKIYVDGTLAGTTVTAGNPDTGTQPFQIGGFGGPFVSNQFINNFGGTIDEVGLFGRALSAAEIQLIYTSGNTGVCNQPLAAFTVTPSTFNCGDAVTFDGSGSTGAGQTVVRYIWNFGDGLPEQTSTSPTIQHTYRQFGTYHPTLIVENSLGALSSPTQGTVEFPDDDKPTAVLQAPNTIGAGETVTFNGGLSTDPDPACGGGIARWTWQIDSNAPVQVTSPTISSTSFPGQLTTGTHIISLVVTDNAGNQSQDDVRQVTVTPRPTAAFTVNPSSASCGDTITFDGGNSVAIPASALTYIWNFGDGTPELQTQTATTQHSYDQLGVYLVTLVVKDTPGGVSLPDQKQVTIRDHVRPSALIQAPNTVLSGTSFTLNGGQSSDAGPCAGVIKKWIWQVDSNAPVEATTPTVSSSLFGGQFTDGTHVVSLKVVDDAGNESVPDFHQLIVKGRPTSVLDVAPNPVGCRQTVTFDGHRSVSDPTESIIRYTWNFGDGSPIVETPGSNTQHVYQQFGQYNATLVVTDSQGASSLGDTKRVTHEDLHAPSALLVAPNSMAIGQAVTFDGSRSVDPDSPCSRIVSWIWQVDGGNAIEMDVPTISSSLFDSQLTAGTHVLSLTVKDDAGKFSLPIFHQLVVTSGSLEITLDTLPDSTTQFTFTGPAPIGSFILDDSPDTSLQATKLRDVAAGSYTVVQQPVQSYALLRIVCTDPDNQSSVELANRSAKIDVDLGETVRCTFIVIDISTPEVAAAALKSLAFTPLEAASFLKSAGFNAAQVATGLRSAQTLPVDQTAQILKDVQFTHTQIANALKTAMGLSAIETALILKNQGFTHFEIATDLRDEFGSTPAQVAQIYKTQQYTLLQITAVLKDVMGQTALQNTLILKNLLYNATEIAGTLQAIFGLTPLQITQELKIAQFTATAIAVALKTGIGLSDALIAQSLKGGLFTAIQTATALKDAFNLGVSEIAVALKVSLYSAFESAEALNVALNQNATQIGVVLHAVFLQSPTQTITILKNLAFTAADIAIALRDAFGFNPTQTGQLLKDALYSASEIATALRNGLLQTNAQITTILKAALFDATQIATALKNSLALTTAQIITRLKNAQFTAQQVATAMKVGLNQSATEIAVMLKGEFNQSVAEVTATLKSIQYNANDVALALRDGNNRNADQIAKLLNDAGFLVEQIVIALKGPLNLGLDQIVIALKAAQLSATVVAVAVKAGLNLTPTAIGVALAVANYTSVQITVALQVGLSQTPLQTTQILKAAAFSSIVIARRLVEAFGMVPAAVAATLKAAEFTATEVTNALQDISTLVNSEILQILIDLQFNSTQITLALKNGMGRTAAQAGVLMIQAGFSASIVALRMVDQYQRNAPQVAAIFASAGVGAGAASVAIISTFQQGLVESMLTLKNAQYTIVDIAIAMRDFHNQDAAQTARNLSQMQYTIAAIAGTLKDEFNVSPQTAARILYDNGATSTQITNALKNQFGRNSAQMATILKALDYSATTIAKRLDDVYNVGASTAAGILKDLDFSSTSIANAMKEGYSRNATQTITILKNLGYSINTQVRILSEVFNKGTNSIQSILLDLGYSLTEILDAIRAVLGI